MGTVYDHIKTMINIQYTKVHVLTTEKRLSPPPVFDITRFPSGKSHFWVLFWSGLVTKKVGIPTLGFCHWPLPMGFSSAEIPSFFSFP